MSPEQLKQDPLIDHRTDIFSLGAVLYEILCGEKPRTVQNCMRWWIPSEPAASRSRCCSEIQSADPAQYIAARCLDKNPDSRFQSMEEVIMLLQQDWMS